MAKDSKRPDKTLRFSSGVKAVIWKNETESGPRYSVFVKRTYRGRDEEFHDTDSFGRDEVLIAAYAFERAYKYMNDATERDRRESDQG